MKNEKLKLKRLLKALKKIEKQKDKDNSDLINVMSVDIFSDSSWGVNDFNDPYDIIAGDDISSLNKWSKGVLNEK